MRTCESTERRTGLSRSSGAAERSLILLVATSVVLVRSPTVVGHKAISTAVVLAILLAGVAWTIRDHRSLADKRLAAIVFAFAGLVSITVLRGERAGVYGSQSRAIAQGASYLLVVSLAVLMVTSARDEAERRRRLAAIALAPAVYGTANALLFIASIQSATADTDRVGLGTSEQAEILAKLGIFVSRVQLPLASGVTTAGVVAGAGLVACFFLRREVSRLICGPLAVGCVLSLLWSDSRTSIAILIVVAAFFTWNKRLIGARWIAPLIPSLPFVVLAVLGFTSTLVSSFSRSANDAYTLNGRVYIWSEAWRVIQHPTSAQVFGWGANGHISSGLSLHYAYVFGQNRGAFAFTTHNIAIQTIFDSGYFGLAVLVVAVFTVLSALSRASATDTSGAVPAMSAVLLVCVLSGVTEVSPSYISEESLVTVLLVMGAAAGLSRTAVQSPMPFLSRGSVPRGEISRTPVS